MSIFSISGLLITVTYLPLFLFIFIKGKTKLTRIYSFHILAVLWWGVFSFIIPYITNQYHADIAWKLAHIGIFLIPVFFIHAVHLLTNKTKLPFITYTYIQGILFPIIIILGFGFTDIKFIPNYFYYTIGNSIFKLGFLNWTIISSIAHLTLINHYKTNLPNEKKQIKLLYASTIGFIGGTCNFLPTFGFDIFPYGNFLVPIHSFVVTYAILKYQFLNIDFVFRKGIVYSLLLIIVLLFYTLTVLICEKALQIYLGYKSLSLSLITAFIIGIAIIPVRNKIQSIIDKTFHTRTTEEIERENELLKQEVVQTDRLKSIATFASGMAHEIKNPLTSIKVFCEYLPEKIHDKKFLETFIPLINKDADRINELVHDLLEYAKPSPPQLIDTDIHKVIESVLDALSSRIINRKIQVIKDFHPNTPLIPLDSKQIKQALLNIILNSLEAMTEQGTLRLFTRRSNNQEKLLITIADNGCGISTEDLPRVFDPFFSKKTKGTGLGLSITHGIIKEHGGKILVDSILGSGSTFRIELPIKVDEA